MTTLEDVINNTAGWGLYNTVIFTMCGFCFMAEGSLTAALSNILPLTVAEINSGEKSLVAYLSTHTAGMALGGVLGGVAQDAMGRRCMVPLALMIAFTGTTIWAFAGNTEFLFTGLLFLGLGLGMHSIALRVYLTEMLPANSRGSRIALLPIFWSVGFFCASALQLLLEPKAEGNPQGFRSTSWRVVLSCSACFTAVVACTCGSLAPSTRWLLAQSRVGAAVEHVRRMYAINKSRHADTFQLPRLRGFITEFPQAWRIREDTVLCTYMVVRMGRQIGACFKRPYTLITIMAIFVRLPILNGMWTDIPWMALLMQYPCRDGKPLNHMDSLETVDDQTWNLKAELFQNIMILAAVVIIATVLLHFIIDLIGHRFMLSTFLAWALVALLCITMKMSFIPNEAIYCIFFGSMLNAEITFTVMTVEMYPTHIRGTASGLIPMLSRIVSIVVSTYLQRGDCLLVTYALLGACGLAMLLLWALPDYTKKSMCENPAPQLMNRDSEAMGTAAARARPVAPAGYRPPAASLDDRERAMLGNVGVDDLLFDVDEQRRDDRGAPLRHAASLPNATLPNATLPNATLLNATLPNTHMERPRYTRGRARYRSDGKSTRYSTRARQVISQQTSTRRRIKTIKIKDTSPESSSSRSRTTEPVELIIISEVPISSTKVINPACDKHLPHKEKPLSKKNLICKPDIRSSRNTVARNGSQNVANVTNKSRTESAEGFAGLGTHIGDIPTHQKCTSGHSQTVTNEIDTSNNSKAGVIGSFSICTSKTEHNTKQENIILSSGNEDRKSEYKDILANSPDVIMHVPEQCRLNQETETKTLTERSFSECPSDCDSMDVNCGSSS